MMDARNHARHSAVHGYCAEIGYEPNGRRQSPWLDKVDKFNGLPEDERTRRLAAAYEAITASPEWQAFEK